MTGARTAWILAALSLLALALAKGDPRLVGRWYGEGRQANGQDTQWIVEYRANETFRIVFRKLAETDCDSTEGQVESGVWRFNPPRLVLITTRVQGKATDMNSGYYRDSYQVTRLDGSGYVIVREGDGLTFSTRRVGRDFTFPAKSGCPGKPGPSISFDWRARGDEV